MYALVLIEKDSPSSDWWKNLVRSKRIENVSVEEVVNKYQGFEGDLVSFFDIQGNVDKLDGIVNQFLQLKKLSNCLLLYVISGSDVMSPLLKEETYLVGYDVGVCDEEKTIYSSIFNEVLFGYFDELVVYKELLNENFLFPDRSIAEKYLELHDRMSAEGKGVEDYEKMSIYEIWKYKG